MKKNLLFIIPVLIFSANVFLSGNANAENRLLAIEKGYVTITPGSFEEVKVSIYPNPLINNQINIESNKEFFAVEILDIVGKKIFSEEFASPLTKKTIRLEGLDNGLYLIRIKFDNKKIYTEKIVIK